jgi:hypothetical protein
VKTPILGSPNIDNVSTSYVERRNLNMRTAMRGFTRLPNGLSNKAENHAHTVIPYFFFYNYCRPHQSLTKANSGIKMRTRAAKVADQMWRAGTCSRS